VEPGFFLRGLLIGFSIAAPVGPIGVLCIRRTLVDGRLAGLVSGLGAATADAFYGSLAGFGLTLVANFLVSQQTWLRLAGGIFLLYLGVKTFLSQPAADAAQVANTGSRGLWGAYLSTLLLTLTNPLTILSFVAIFAGLGLAGTGGNTLSAGMLVLGVFCGSASWWLLLSGGVGLLRGRLTPRILQWVNRLAGAVIVIFGIVALVL
jgi:threonine/homoserine/homoserine lactone efflux protein